MNILAIDPGTTESAWVVFDTTTARIVVYGIAANVDVLMGVAGGGYDEAAIEAVAFYGMAVGQEVFDTCIMVGELKSTIKRVLGKYPILVYRKRRGEVESVCMHLCHSTNRVGDAEIRQALIDRFGPGKDRAIGTKKNPGPLYGIKGDEWAALAVAVVVADHLTSAPVAAQAAAGVIAP